MSRILEALEKAHREAGPARPAGAAGHRAGIFALPGATRTVSVPTSALRKVGWVSALSPPPRGSQVFAALADRLCNWAPVPARVLVCGATRRAGTTAASLNLATELALTGDHTALWCEVPYPRNRAWEFLGSACRHGLADHLRRDLPLRDLLVRTQVPRLTLLPGRGTATPALPPPDGEALSRFLEEVAGRSPDRYVVVDAPPPTECAATVRLAASCEATVLVVATGTSQQTLAEVKEALGEIPRCAVLLNRAPRLLGG
ncbi:MAG: hypothetical protein Kow0092_21720 [Deferrisomatales bacterium]